MVSLNSIEGKITFDGREGMIRPMRESDLDAVVKMEKESFSDPWSKDAFRIEMKEGTANAYVVETVNGGVVAYLVFRTVFDELHILNIAVDEHFRRKGIAQTMLTFFIDQAKTNNLQIIFLEVRESNASAIDLYKKLGFKIIGRRKFYYFNPDEDALVMSLKI